MLAELKRLMVGQPLATEQLAHERLTKRIALAVFSSDALSSVAYATEAILIALMAAQSGALGFATPISVGIALLLITVAGMIGIQTTSFVAVIGALGLAVGLALQGSLANFAGGVLLLMFKPFKVGDLIESNGQTGHVQSIQIFNTILLTAENKTVILANGAVSNNTIINYSKHGTIRVDIVMAIAPDADVEKARNIALQTMASNKFVLKDPAPSVNVLKIGDGMVTLAIRPFATPPDYWDAFFSVQEELKAAFDKNQVAGPTPTRIIINKQGSN